MISPVHPPVIWNLEHTPAGDMEVGVCASSRWISVYECIWMSERIKGFKKTTKKAYQTHGQPSPYIKNISQQRMYQQTFFFYIVARLFSSSKNQLSTPLLNNRFPHSMLNGHTHSHTHVTHTVTHAHMPSKASQKCYDPQSLCDCTSFTGGLLLHTLCMSQHFGVTLHHPSWWKRPSNTAFVTETDNNEVKSIWNTGFISNVGCFTSYLAERETEL